MVARRRRIVEALRRVGVLADLDERSLQLVAAATQWVRVEEGQMLVEQGWPGFELFFVVEGSARVSADDTEVATLGPGDWFGETSLLENRPRTATVTAVTPMVLLSMGRRSFSKLVERRPDLARLLEKSAPDLRDLGAS